MAKKIGIVVDSPADFPAGMVERFGLHILPVHIFVNGKDHLHGVDISNKEVAEDLKKRKKVYTKPFFPGECANLFERLCDRYDAIFSFHVSNELSGNYKSAKSALNLLPEEDAKKIKLIDTGNVSVGQGLVVKKALELIIKNTNRFNLETRLEPYKSSSFLFITVENLFWLKQGGRVSAFSAFVGGMLDIKPIIKLSDTKLVPVEKHRGKRAAIDRIVEMGIEAKERTLAEFDIWIGHLDAEEDALYVRDQMVERMGAKEEEVVMVEVGPTIAAHAGPGSLSLGMIPKEHR